MSAFGKLIGAGASAAGKGAGRVGGSALKLGKSTSAMISSGAGAAAKKGAKSSDEIAGASAKTTKTTKQIDSAADVGKAGKQADAGGDVAKATKKADDVADAGGDATKASKKADDAADAAKAGKAGKKGVDAMTVAKYTAAGGLAYYVSEQIGAANEKVGDCIENCLPDNWASYEYEEIGKDELNFKNLEELQAENPEYDEPICTAKINDGKQGPCTTFCSKTCNDKYDKGVLDALGPAGDVIKNTTGAAGDVMEQTLDDLGLNPFGPGGLLEGMKETVTRVIFIILCICCLSILLKLLGIF